MLAKIKSPDMQWKLAAQLPGNTLSNFTTTLFVWKSRPRAICKLQIQFQFSNCSKSGVHFLTRGMREHRKGKGMSEHLLHAQTGKVSSLNQQPAHVENL